MEHFTNQKKKTYPIFLTPRQVEVLTEMASGDPDRKLDQSPEAAHERMEIRRKIRVAKDAIGRREKEG